MRAHHRSRLCLAILAGIASLNAQAAGLGEATVRSVLNEPLKADVPMLALSADEAEQARVVIRSAGQPARGSTVESIVSRLRGQFIAQGDGRYALRISSRENIREPVLTFAVEVELPHSHVRRQYTLLLDPPAVVMGRAQAAYAAPTAAVDPTPTRPYAPLPLAALEQPFVQGRGTPRKPWRERRGAGSAPPSGRLNAEGTYGPVAPNETLWRIAARVRATSTMSIPDMVAALHRANPEAFIGHDIDRLKVGVLLRVPTSSGIAGDVTSAALAKTAAAPAPDATQENSMKPGEAVASVGSPAPIDAASEEEIAATLREAAAVTQHNEELRARLASLQTHIAELEAATVERDARISEIQAALDKVTPVAEHSRGAAASDELPVTGQVYETAAPHAGTAAQAPEINNAPAEELEAAVGAPKAALLTAAGAIPTGGPARWWLGGALLAAAIAFMTRNRLRRRRALRETERLWAEREKRATKLRAQVTQKAGQYSPRTPLTVAEDYSSALPDRDAQSHGHQQEARIVPLNPEQSRFELLFREVDLQLVYHQFAEAETLLRSALDEFPEEWELHAKLAELYSAAEEVDRFIALASKLNDQRAFRDSPLWERVAMLGVQLCPSHPLFADTGFIICGDADPRRA